MLIINKIVLRKIIKLGEFYTYIKRYYKKSKYLIDTRKWNDYNDKLESWWGKNELKNWKWIQTDFYSLQ